MGFYGAGSAWKPIPDKACLTNNIGLCSFFIHVFSLSIALASSASRHQDVINGFIDFGARLVRLAAEQAEAATFPVEKTAAACDRVTSGVRKSIWLVHKLAAPSKGRLAVRKRIIRTVEDAIHCNAERPEAENPA